MAIDQHDPALMPVASPSHEPIDFQVFTYAAPDATYAYADDLLKLVGKPEKRSELAALPRPLVPMTGSSTQRDLGRDRMRITALQDMTKCEDNLSIFINHDYTLPESLYGSMQGKPEIHISGEFADLTFTSDVELLNERAAMVYLYSVRNRKMGVSGGFMVNGVEWVDAKTEQPVADEDVDIWDVIAGAVLCDITHVKMIEQSVVGIPSNQRSWVESGLKGFFARTHDPKLAPIVRSLWPQQYKDTLKSVTDAKLYQELHDVAPRHQKPAPQVYFLADGFKIIENKRERPATRKDVAALFETLLQAHTPMLSRQEIPDDTKSASDEDKAAQEARSKKYGIGIKETTNVTKPSEWASVPDAKWGDPVNYRYPANDESHARNALSRWGDPDNRSQYSSEEQSIVGGRIKRIAKSYGIDVSDDEKGTEPDMTPEIIAEKIDDAVPDETKAMPSAADVDVSSDGSHAKCTGTHSHIHPVGDSSQGDDKTHTHSHPHDGDNTHTGAAHTGGSHDKAAEPDKVVSVGDTMHADPDHTLVVGKDVPAANIGTMQQTEAPASQSATVTTFSAPPPVVPPSALPEFRAGLCKSYNDLLAPYGLQVLEASATPDTTKCDWSDDQASAIRAGIAAVDAASDALMRVAGVPDDDDFGASDGDADSLPMPLYGRMSLELERIATKMARYTPLLTKAGARHSASDQGHIQAIHDHACSAGASCAASSSDDTPETGSANNTDMQDARAGMATGKALETLEALVTSFKDATEAMQKTGLDALKKEADTLRSAYASLSADKDTIAEALERYGSQPFGRPTRTNGVMQTTRAADPAAITLAQLTTPADPEAALLAQTTVTYIKGVGKVRQWPEGVGAGNRPMLSTAQRGVLDYLPNGDAIREAYEAGHAASIPIVDDGD